MEAELAGDADAGSGRIVKNQTMEASVEVKNGVEFVESKMPVGEVTFIAPITPVPAREVRDIRGPGPSGVVQCLDSRTDAEIDKECECYSPRTPKQGVFDPFAPGPNGMLLAPKLDKMIGESRISVARQLHFDFLSSGESSGIFGRQTSSDEEKLLGSVYGSLLDVIVPSKSENNATEKSSQDEESDGFKTPPLVPYLHGISKKCPNAPMKLGRPASKRLHIDPSLCRKLEF